MEKKRHVQLGCACQLFRPCNSVSSSTFSAVSCVFAALGNTAGIGRLVVLGNTAGIEFLLGNTTGYDSAVVLGNTSGLDLGVRVCDWLRGGGGGLTGIWVRDVMSLLVPVLAATVADSG